VILNLTTGRFCVQPTARRELLTHARREDLARDLGLKWKLFNPFYNLRWTLRPWLAKLLRRPNRPNFTPSWG